MLRGSALGVTLILAVAVVFFGGYWLGWQFEPRTRPATETGSPSLGPDAWTNELRATKGAGMPALTTVHAPAEDREQSTRDRVLRLAGWLGTARDSRAADARVTADLAAMSLGEVWEAMMQLQVAPASAAVAALRSKLLLRWATLDPAAAFDYWRRNIKSLRWSDSLASQVLDRWARMDAAGALDCWKTLVKAGALRDHEQGYPLRRIFARMARQDFDQALAQARTIGNEHRTEALRGLGDSAYRPGHRTRLLDELSAWSPDEGRNEALAATVVSWALSGETDQAMAWLEHSELEEASRFKIVEEIGLRRFHEDHQAGADWLLARARTDEQRATVLADIVSNWVQYDVVGSGEWLLAQGLDRSASQAMQVYAAKLTTDFPEQALLWTLRIPDPAVREAALARIEERLRQQHPNRADELLGLLDDPSASLPPGSAAD
ncbi:MAG: hypothetical protein H7A47_06045 [Verrucomicrobiales bacterium]|nr:hypothetical protein [Verrucomicrobiales bacterium]